MQLLKLIRRLVAYLGSLWDWLVPPEKGRVVRPAQKGPPILQVVESARRDWEAAQAYFNNVTDPDLIDHAIYQVQAAERKYVYLLRRAEEFGYQEIPLSTGEAPPQTRQPQVTEAQTAGTS